MSLLKQDGPLSATGQLVECLSEITTGPLRYRGPLIALRGLL